VKKTVIEDTSAALDVLDGLTDQLSNGNLNVIMAFSKSAENLLTDNLDQDTLDSMQEKMATKDETTVCQDSECNNAGKDGNTSKCSISKTE